jgi:hypothetical protein
MSRRPIGEVLKRFIPRFFLNVLLLASLITGTSLHVLAQAVAVAEVTGYVSDTAGMSIPGATVTIVETGKHEVHTVTTDARTGRYSFTNLAVGTYNLTVSQTGFQKYVQSGIVLQVANNVDINVSLQVGAVEQTVEVRADAIEVETKDNSIAEVLDNKRINDLPLNGRNPTQIITLTGAATTMRTTDLTTSKSIGGSNASGTFSVAGGQGNGLNYLLDGGDNNDAMFNLNLPLPFPDALEEFSVQTTALPAQYGLRAGGVVNAVTRSGANSFHGGVFEFLRNGILDGIQDGTPSRDNLKRSQFGGTIGGRILPNKLFFFTGYQGTRQRSSPPSAIAFVPTPAVLSGNWSNLETPASQGGCLSASTTRQLKNPAGGTFAGNQIPTNLYDPAAVALATKYLPVPTNPCGQVQFAFVANNPDDQVIGRVDYILNPKHSMYGRYYIYDFTAQVVFNGSNLLTTGTAGNTERSQIFTFGDTYTLSPTMVNSFHGTFNRRRDNRGAPANDISSSDLGINISALVPHYNFIAVTGDFSSGCSTCSPGYFNANTFQVSDDVNWTRGKHEFAFGADFRRLQSNLLINTDANGSFTFDGTYTGDALGDFMLGRIGSLIQDFPQRDELRQTVFSFYAQDTIHLTKRFTANVGLRWEPDEFPYDRQGRDAEFSQAAFNAGTTASKKYPNAPAGLIFPGDPGSGPGLSQVHSHWGEVSPRLGFIYDPRGNGKQVIRGGFGLMHESIYMFYPERWTYGAPFGSQVNLSHPVGDTFSNPWQNQVGGNLFASSGAFFPVGGAYYIIPSDFKPMYELQWNLNVQRKVGPNWLLQASYLGTKTVHIPTSYDINPSVYIAGSSAPTNQRRLLYLQNPSIGQYYSAIYSGDDGGNSKYNAMLLSAQHGFAKNFNVTANYTWSHCTSDADVQGEVAGTYRENPYNRSFDRGNCAQNVASLFNISGVAQSPGVGSDVARALTRNWQLSGLVTWRSGTPLNITDGGVDVSQTGQGNDRPNQIAAAYPKTKTTKQWINPAAFQRQAAGTFGNVGRDSLSGPNALNFDASFGRTFHIKEHFNYLFRVDAFNALNHPTWNNPTTSITSSQIGKITSFGSPRILQIGSKLTF